MSPVRDPFATAVVSEARRTGARVVSVRDDGLRSLGQGFDTLYPRSGSIDDTLTAVVSRLRLDGATVALLTTSEMAAQHEADITVGVTRSATMPWGQMFSCRTWQRCGGFCTRCRRPAPRPRGVFGFRFPVRRSGP